MKWKLSEFIKSVGGDMDEVIYKLNDHYQEFAVIGFHDREDQLDAYNGKNVFPSCAYLYVLDKNFLDIGDKKMYLVKLLDNFRKSSTYILYDNFAEAKAHLKNVEGKLLPELSQTMDRWLKGTDLWIRVHSGLPFYEAYDLHIFNENREVAKCYNLTDELKEMVLQINSLLDHEVNGYFIENLSIQDNSRCEYDLKNLKLYVTIYNPDADESGDEEIELGQDYPDSIKETLINKLDWQSWNNYFKTIKNQKGEEITL